MLSRLIIALCALLLMTSAGQGAARLSAAEINALAPGAYVGTWKAKRQLYLTLNTNGTISGSVDGYRYAGKWYVSGRNLCVSFKILSVTKTKCGDIHRQGVWLVGYYNKKGKPRIRLRSASGALAVAHTE
jgi:hypothetical protein